MRPLGCCCCCCYGAGVAVTGDLLAGKRVYFRSHMADPVHASEADRRAAKEEVERTVAALGGSVHAYPSDLVCRAGKGAGRVRAAGLPAAFCVVWLCVCDARGRGLLLPKGKAHIYCVSMLLHPPQRWGRTVTTTCLLPRPPPSSAPTHIHTHPPPALKPRQVDYYIAAPSDLAAIGAQRRADEGSGTGKDVLHVDWLRECAAAGQLLPIM